MTNAAYRYSIQLDHELHVARWNARARLEEARVRAAAGEQLVADILLVAARMYEDSAQYWEEELRRHGGQ
jgi:hypothetical protein